MTYFTAILKNTVVASTENNITVTNGFSNITITNLLAKLRCSVIGPKEGGHHLRTNLKLDAHGGCVSRSNEGTESHARIVILDCDSNVNYTTGELVSGAPDPYKVSQILQSQNIWHVLYGTYSHYVNDKGSRY